MKKSYVKESASSHRSFSFEYYISYNINVFTVFEAFSQAHQSQGDNKTKAFSIHTMPDISCTGAKTIIPDSAYCGR